MKTHKRRWTAVAFLSAALACGLAVPLQARQAAPAAPSIADLAWMAGDWRTGGGGTQTTEHWTRPEGGTMLGMGRTIAGGKTVFFEYLRIETRADGIFYVAHPKARPGTDFKLTRLAGQEAVFENPKHDFPKRIIYRKAADGALVARIEGDGTEKEKPQEFRYLPTTR